jgi:hypothetical protein
VVLDVAGCGTDLLLGLGHDLEAMPLSKAFQVMALVGDGPVVPASVVE